MSVERGRRASLPTRPTPSAKGRATGSRWRRRSAIRSCSTSCGISCGTTCPRARRSIAVASWVGCGTTLRLAGISTSLAILTPGAAATATAAFDGDVDIGIGLVFAARQWPEYTTAAVNWPIKMECEVNSAYDGKWNYPAPGDTFDKNCAGYPGQACSYTPGFNGRVNMSYYPPGYFRVFGDFLATSLDPASSSATDRSRHHDFWYKTAQTVWEMVERCYDQPSVNPALFTDWGHYDTPCDANADNYNWSRALWRVSIDAAWFGG